MSSLFAKDSANNNIKLSVKGKTLTIASAVSQTGSAKSDIEAIVKGEELEIAVNARYVLEILGTISDEKISFGCNGSTSACVLTTAGDKDFLYVIMPLKLDN